MSYETRHPLLQPGTRLNPSLCIFVIFVRFQKKKYRFEKLPMSSTRLPMTRFSALHRGNNANPHECAIELRKLFRVSAEELQI